MSETSAPHNERPGVGSAGHRDGIKPHTPFDKARGIIDIPYLLSPLGILKFIQLVIGVICIGGVGTYGHVAHQWFLGIVIVCFIITLFLLIFYTFRLIDRFSTRWNLIEVIFGVLVTILYIIIGSVQAAYSFNKAPWIMAAVFAFINAAAYAISTVFSFREWRTSRELSGR